MQNFKKTILITGGCGFIGSHVVRHFVKKYPEYKIINLDNLTYAGNLDNLKDIENCPNYVFEKCNIEDFDSVYEIVEDYDVDNIIHLAAESHVDNSIKDPLRFVRTNIEGTVNLLHAALYHWGEFEGKKFYHISTDEVYGSLEVNYPEGTEFFDKVRYGLCTFHESDPYKPHSPYSASKASSDHFVRAYHDTYGLPVVISNCSNNYGPYQYPEKLIPLFVKNIMEKKPLPVYGEGLNVRDWLYVEDHVAAIDRIFHRGEIGETYNIGGDCEKRNIDLVHTIVKIADRLLGNPEGTSDHLITFVGDRLGHDLRYAINCEKLKSKLGWTQKVSFEEGIEKTVKWYIENQEWLENIEKRKKVCYI